jgi:hypothetical protein
MHLVEILLPVTRGDGFRAEVTALGEQLTARFGGVTTFLRSPGEGLWEHDGSTEKDSIVVIEVMTGAVDRAWWQQLRTDLERRLRQKEVVIRTYAIERL